MAKYAFSAPGMSVSDLETAIGNSTGLAIGTAAELTKIDQAITAVGLAVCSWETGVWWWQRDTLHINTHAKTVETTANTGAARASNVATIKTTAAHGLNTGQLVEISGVADATFDGIWQIASVPTTTTLTYANVGDNVAASGSGSLYVVSYPLRSITAAGAYTATAANQVGISAYSIESIVYDDDWQLRPVPWNTFRRVMLLDIAGSATKPTQYCLFGDPPQLGLWPPPDSTYKLFLNLVKRHSKIIGGDSGAEDAALIIPAEFHWELYVNGATWLLKHETVDPASLRDCPAFMAGIQRMVLAAPDNHDPDNAKNMFPDAQPGRWPRDRRVIADAGGILIQNTVTL